MKRFGIFCLVTALILILSAFFGCSDSGDKRVNVGKVVVTVPAGLKEGNQDDKSSTFTEALYYTESGRCYMRVFSESGDYKKASEYLNALKEQYGYEGSLTVVSGDDSTAYLSYTVKDEPSLRGYVAAKLIDGECWFVDYMENTDVPSDVEYYPMFREWSHEMTAVR